MGPASVTLDTRLKVEDTGNLWRSPLRACASVMQAYCKCVTSSLRAVARPGWAQGLLLSPLIALAAAPTNGLHLAGRRVLNISTGEHSLRSRESNAGDSWVRLTQPSFQ
jgi:hypothetical protein